MAHCTSHGHGVTRRYNIQDQNSCVNYYQNWPLLIICILRAFSHLSFTQAKYGTQEDCIVGRILNMSSVLWLGFSVTITCFIRRIVGQTQVAASMGKNRLGSAHSTPQNLPPTPPTNNLRRFWKQLKNRVFTSPGFVTWKDLSLTAAAECALYL